ncbi:MAG: glycosyltransferase family 39 protein [Actinobacteria bacterium]|nr:glycosyltransferase family 39 protein [Actinomycetota bacterium]
MKLVKKIALLCLIGIVLILRFWGLDKVPPHLRNDEAALGYNAYSILQTAKDEHGHFLPILFQSFGDWKPGLYVYLTIPFVAVLGLSEWAVRLPAAISGILGIYLLYHLVWNLFGNRRIAFASAFSLAITPWHIAFSRGAWEAQVSVTLILAGLVFLIKSINGKHKYLIASAGFFGLSLLTSHSAKPAIPLVLLSFFIAYSKKFCKIPFKIILLSCLVFLILSLPVILSFFNGKSTRVSSLMFSNKYHDGQLGLIANDFLYNWANHYNLSVLFLKGDGNPQHTAADFGAFIALDLVLLFLGFKTLIRLKTINHEAKIFILFLLILTPLSSALTIEGVNFVRYLMFLTVINILIGLGINNFKINFTYAAFSLLYIFSYLLFLDAYFIHTPAKNGAWQYGYKETIQTISMIQKKFPKIYIPQGGDQPYIFFLFYQNYTPWKFQAISSAITIPNGSGMGMDYISQLENIEFVDFNKFNPPANQSFLVVLPANHTYSLNLPLKTIYEIKDPIGLTIYKLEEYIPKNE